MAWALRMMRRAISPRLATRSLVITGTPWRPDDAASHPEHAVAACPVDGVVVDDRQAQAQNRAGVAGIDDPVVIEPGRKEKGQRFGLDLGFDGGPHGRVGLLVEGQTPRFGT